MIYKKSDGVDYLSYQCIRSLDKNFHHASMNVISIELRPSQRMIRSFLCLPSARATDLTLPNSLHFRLLSSFFNVKTMVRIIPKITMAAKIPLRILRDLVPDSPLRTGNTVFTAFWLWLANGSLFLSGRRA